MKSSEQTRMPFGKHQNTPLDQLPDSYLSFWHLTPLFPVNDWLKEGLEKEYRRRQLDNGAQQRRELMLSIELPHSLAGMARMIFGIGIEHALRISHPDVCGSDGTLSAAVQRLKEDIERQLRSGDGGIA